MIRLSNFSQIKKLALASIIILPSQVFSNEIPVDQNTLMEKSFQALEQLRELSNENDDSSYSVQSKSKQGSDAIMGEWSISYTYNGSHSDKIVLDHEWVSNDGEVFAEGVYYSGQASNSIPILCFDIDSIYSCLTLPPAGRDTVGFMFSITGNSIVDGFFGKGSTIESVFEDFQSRQYPIVGSRGSTPPTTSECLGEVILDSNLNFHIPSVKYGDRSLWIDLDYSGENAQGQPSWGMKAYGENP